MYGPTIVRVAATNEPHIRLRDHPLSIVKIEDEDYLRIPLLIKGRYSHPAGDLNFDDAFFNKVIENHEKEVWDSAPYFRVGHKRDKALAWLDKSKGGFLRAEGNVLVGYARPINEEAKRVVEGGEYRYASIDLAPNYKSNLKELIVNSSQLDEVIKTGDVMTIKDEKDKTTELETPQTSETPSSDNTDLMAQIAALTTKLAEVEAKLETREESTEEETPETPEEPTNAELERFSNRVLELERKLRNERVSGIVERLKLFRDPEGRGHSTKLIETVRDILLHKDISNGEETITLESSTDTDSYFVGALGYLVLNCIPGSINLEKTTQSETAETLTKPETEVDETVYKSWWKLSSSEINI